MTDKRTYTIEDFCGAILLIAGLFALGLFNFQSDEPLVEAGLRAQSSAIVADTVHGLQVTVDGRHMTLTGLADTREEKTNVLSALKALDGRGRVRSDVEVLAPADPFVLTALRSGQEPMQFDGAVPTEALRDDLRRDYGAGVDAMTLASGMPGVDWPAVLQTALRALGELEEGKLVLENRRLRISGAALTPVHVERALLLLADLPEGYVFDTDLNVRDDGTPLRLSASRSDGALTGVSGKLPAALTETIGDGAFETSALAPPIEGWGEGVLAALGALDHLHTGYLSITGPSVTLTGDAWSQDSYDAAMAALEGMPKGMSVTGQIELADTGAPFSLSLSKSQTGVVAAGKVPQSLAPRVLAALTDAPLQSDALTIARISPGPLWWEAASLGAEALRYFVDAELTFNGAELRLAGYVQDPARLEQLERHLDAMPEGMALVLNATLIDDGNPLRVVLEFDGSSIVLGGKLPDTLRADQLAVPLGVPVLTGELVSTPKLGPDDWVDTALAAAEAVPLMERGTLRITGRELDLRGVLRDPKREEQVQQLLAGLPEAYVVTSSFEFQDDGRPFGFTLVFDGRRGTLNGKVPLDLGPASQAAILGFPIEAGTLEFATIPADADWWVAARSGLKALADLDHGTLMLDAHQITLSGATSEAAVVGNVQNRMQPFEESFKVKVDIIAE